jgi:hypothetical protein
MSVSEHLEAPKQLAHEHETVVHVQKEFDTESQK